DIKCLFWQLNRNLRFRISLASSGFARLRFRYKAFILVAQPQPTISDIVGFVGFRKIEIPA
ncbi:hypothetical protein, partial [Adonisia turfae]|uniref:hypothetical protein n=1 Tax=Adonisia turfae TaxID=2950184 RepID=UPI002029A31D